MWSCFEIKVVVFRQTVNDMFSNTAGTQQDALHSISHSAFNLLHRVYNGMMTTHHKTHLHFLDNSPARMMAPSAMPGSNYPPPSLTIELFFWTTHRFSAAARNLFYHFLFYFFQKPQIILSLLVNNQLSMQATLNIALLKTNITTKVIHHN
jgi:hypothetical protein